MWASSPLHFNYTWNSRKSQYLFLESFSGYSFYKVSRLVIVRRTRFSKTISSDDVGIGQGTELTAAASAASESEGAAPTTDAWSLDDASLGAPLRPMQKLFCDWYLRTWDATESARNAGYSEKSASISGSRNTRDPRIQAEIKRRLSASAMKADEVLHRLGEQARGDIGKYFKIAERWTDWPLPTEEIVEERRTPDPVTGVMARNYRVRSVVVDVDALLDPTKSRLIKKFTDSPKSGIVLELYDAQAALSLLGKHHKLFSDQQIDITVKIRQLAEEQGLDPDEAVEEAMRVLRASRS